MTYVKHKKNFLNSKMIIKMTYVEHKKFFLKFKNNY